MCGGGGIATGSDDDGYGGCSAQEEFGLVRGTGSCRAGGWAFVKGQEVEELAMVRFGDFPIKSTGCKQFEPQR